MTGLDVFASALQDTLTTIDLTLLEGALHKTLCIDRIKISKMFYYRLFLVDCDDIRPMLPQPNEVQADPVGRRQHRR